MRISLAALISKDNILLSSLQFLRKHKLGHVEQYSISTYIELNVVKNITQINKTNSLKYRYQYYIQLS